MSSLRRALVGGELVPGVPQVVKVNALQADRAIAGSQIRLRTFEWDSGEPVELAKTSAPDEGSQPRCLRTSGTIRSGKATTRRPALDLGGRNE